MVTLDNVQYKVRVKIRSLNRSFRIEESERSGAVKSGDYFRDIIGTYYDYEMEVEPDPSAPEDYDAFYEMISAPVESHSVVVPYGQGTMTYDAMVSTGDDTKRDKINGVTRWTGLKVKFPRRNPKGGRHERHG